jgi:hypothetical protein
MQIGVEMAKRLCVIMLVFVFGILGLWAQENGDYRSRATGNWNSNTTWSIYSSGSWNNASSAPIVSTNATITIQNGHTVTNNDTYNNNDAGGQNRVVVQSGGSLKLTKSGASTQFRSLVIEEGGTMTQTFGYAEVTEQTVVSGSIERLGTSYDHVFRGGCTVTSTGVYIHRLNGGTIPECTWEPGSTLILTGIKSNSIIALESYQKVEWNCSLQESSLALEENFNTIMGDFIINSTNGRVLYLANSTSNREMFIGGDLGIAGGTFSIKGSTGDSGDHIVYVEGDYLQSGGYLHINRQPDPLKGTAVLDIKGNFTMSGGFVTSPNSTSISQIIFSKAGIQTFTKTGGTISNIINFTVNPGSTLDLGSSVIDGSIGAFTLSEGAGLITAHPFGISTSGTSGSIQVGGVRSFNIGADYTYNGTVPQITGSGLPATVRNLIIDNPEGVTLSNSVTVTGDLIIRAGTIDPNVNTLTVNGTVSVEGGNLPASANISISAYESSANFVSIIPESGTISGLAVSTNPNGATEANMVNRTWNISGSVPIGTRITLTWTAEDDGNFDWTDAVPVVYQGSTVLDIEDYDERTVTVIVNSLEAKAEFSIEKRDGDTLPVELSSFSAALSASGYISINWIAQSETNLLGYRLYRASVNDFAAAVVISPLISATNTSNLVAYQFEDTQIFEDGSYYYWLQSIEFDGLEILYDPCVIFYDRPGSSANPAIPLATAITGAYPNPFNPTGTIQFSLINDAKVKIQVYNQRGQIVRKLADQSFGAGHHHLQWSGRDESGNECGTGIYLIRMDVEGRGYSRKVALVK